MNFPALTTLNVRTSLTVALLALASYPAPPVHADIAQAPLFLTTAVKPNVMLMLDSSGSMDEDVTVDSSGTAYDPNTTYLANANCNKNPMPVSTSGMVRNDRYDSKKACRRAGLTWNDGRCYSNTNSPISYGSTIPDSFYGQTTGSGRRKTVGKQCFVQDYSYQTSLSLPSGVSTDAQIANYLNWYYSNELAKTGTTSTRIEVAKSAASLLVDSLVGQVRLGLSTYNSSDGGKLWEAVDELTDAKKTTIQSRINAISPSGYTPLAETMSDIGHYFATGSNNVVLHAGTSSSDTISKSSVFNNHSLSNSSGSANPIQYSCQKSFAVLLTDGLPTKDQDIASLLRDYDGDCSGSNSSQCSSYDLKKAYGSGSLDTSDYLDDVTQALYEMDLRPDLRNDYESPGAKNNVTTFVIGFADDSINPDLPGVNPLPKNAALQGGGQFYYARNATDLSASLASAFSFIIGQSASSSSVATNSTHYQTNSLIYQAIFDSNTWSGDLIAYRLKTEDSNANGVLDVGEDTNGNGKIDAGAIGDQLWSAAESLPAAAARSIYSYNPSAATKGIEFTWNNLNSNQQSILKSAAIVDYLRGDQSEEVDNGGALRNRTHILGDIINSDPLYVAHDNLGYSSLPEGSSYDAFAATARPEMIYVAANDGMLHAFDAGIDGRGGIEQFAYLPNAAISSTLVTLTEPNYVHQYITDGSPQSGDVYYDDKWHTVLVSSLGAGGDTLFALDITDPDGFDESDVLWEFSDEDLGYTLPQSSIVRLANGQWAAIAANGYNSPAGKAVLYVIDIKTGAIIKKITADSSGGNGLSSPVVVDVDNDNITDYVYAGDLNGNLWKFDLSDANPVKWGVAFNGSPLFEAQDADGIKQAITAKPAVSKATATGQSTGMMVYFGTGKYFETGDNIVSSNAQIQTFYGLWDKCDKSMSSCGNIAGRGTLQKQTIVYEGNSGTTTLADGSHITGDIRVTSHCEVAFGATQATTTDSPCSANSNSRGWYLDLLSPHGVQGERVVSTAVIRNGVVIFPTLIPTTETCTPGGTSWLMELEQFSGARLEGSPIDLNEDGVVDEKDLVKIDGSDTVYAVSALKSTVGIIDTPAIINCENGLDCKYAAGSSGNLMTVKEDAPKTTPATPKAGTRTSWQQLFVD